MMSSLISITSEVANNLKNEIRLYFQLNEAVKLFKIDKQKIDNSSFFYTKKIITDLSHLSDDIFNIEISHYGTLSLTFNYKELTFYHGFAPSYERMFLVSSDGIINDYHQTLFKQGFNLLLVNKIDDMLIDLLSEEKNKIIIKDMSALEKSVFKHTYHDLLNHLILL